MRKAFFVCACSLLLLQVLVASYVSSQNASASTKGAYFYEEITGLPFHPRAVDVNSEGTIFALSYDQDLWRSTDNGASWVKIFDDGLDWSNYSPIVKRNFLLLYVDSGDRIFLNIQSKTTGIYTLYRSVDGGTIWSVVAANSQRKWHMDESANSTLWFHTYTGPGWATIHKSIDHGATWSVFQNLTMTSEDLRSIAVNDYNDDEIWVATSRRILYWNGSDWITTHVDNRSQSYISSIWFDQNYVYLGAEYLGGKKTNWRYEHAPRSSTAAEWANYDYYWDADKLALVPDEHSFRGLRIDDIMLFGIRSQLWGSWDGNRWIKVVDFGNSTASDIESISQRSPIYFVDKKPGKLYRLNITKEDLVKLYYSEFLKHRGNLINQDNYTAEYRISNGTNELDLTSVALSNVQASIKGLSRRNYLNNSGFEDGTNAWAFFGAGVYASSTTDTHEGARALKIMKDTGDTDHLYVMQDYIAVSSGDVLTLSAWVKANKTLVDRFALVFRNQSGSLLKLTRFNVTTTWTRARTHYSLNNPAIDIRAEIWAQKGETCELLVDGIQLEKREVEILRQEPNIDAESIEHLQYQPSPYFSGSLDTTHPKIIIKGQPIWHLGTLTNGTESATATISDILTGIIEVEANIGGSGQAILRITGTRILYEDSVILKDRTDTVYYGRCYGDFIPSTTTNDLITVTDLQARIEALSYANNNLTLAIDSLAGTLSTILIYVGDRGEPGQAVGAVAWIYNATTKTVAIQLFHQTKQQTISVYWTERIPPSTAISLHGTQGNNGWFTSDVAIALTSADNLSGVDRTEYSYDNSVWATYTNPFTVNTEGTTTIYYRSTDNDGNTEITKTTAMIIDKTKPYGSILINGVNTYTTSTSVELTLTANDLASGVYKIRLSNDGVWDTELWEDSQLTVVWTLLGEDGAKTVYLQIQDVAGHVSETYLDEIILDTTPPVGSILINGGAAYTTSPNVTIGLSGEDITSTISEVHFSDDSILWTPWESYTTTKTWTLPIGDGQKTVYAQYMDAAGLVSHLFQDTIILDVAKPNANAGRDQTINVGIPLNFDASNSTDNLGILSYNWDFGDGSTGSGKATSHVYSHVGTYTVTLSVKDASGNTATDYIEVIVTEERRPMMLDIWIVGTILLAAGITISMIIVGKRRKQ